MFMLLLECSLKALADKVALKWQKYLQFKSEIYLAYVGVSTGCLALTMVAEFSNYYCLNCWVKVEVYFCHMVYCDN